jgi:hypothetical protein
MTYSGPSAPSPEPEGDPTPTPGHDRSSAHLPAGRNARWWLIGAALLCGLAIGLVLTRLIG